MPPPRIKRTEVVMDVALVGLVLQGIVVAVGTIINLFT